jgi:hypothetical protein
MKVPATAKAFTAERLSRPDLASLLAPAEYDVKPLFEESKRLRARLAKIDSE